MGGSLISPIVGGVVTGGGSAAVGNQAWEYDTPDAYTWENPGVDWVEVLWAGGGSNGTSTGGGGGGEVRKRRIYVGDVESVSIVIGAGGEPTASNVFNPGGSTSFGDLVALGAQGKTGGGRVNATYARPPGDGSACGGDGADPSSTQSSWAADNFHCPGYGRCLEAYGGGGSMDDGGVSTAKDGTRGSGGYYGSGVNAGAGGDGYMLITA